QGWLAWVAFTPLITALWFSPFCAPAPVEGVTGKRKRLLRRPPFRGALLGYVTGLVFFWIAFSWLTTVTGVGWFILPFYMALYPAAFGAYLVAFKGYAGDFTHSGKNLVLAISGAAAWTAL